MELVQKLYSQYQTGHSFRPIQQLQQTVHDPLARPTYPMNRSVQLNDDQITKQKQKKQKQNHVELTNIKD